MLCELHSVYKIIHCIHCVILHRGSQIIIHYTVKGKFFAFNLEKNYTWQKKFTQAPPVVPVTNMRYDPGSAQDWETSSDLCNISHLADVMTHLLPDFSSVREFTSKFKVEKHVQVMYEKVPGVNSMINSGRLSLKIALHWGIPSISRTRSF